MWKRIRKRRYRHCLEVLPPAYQDGRGFLLGEPQDHGQCEVEHVILPRYAAFVEKGGRYYQSIRPLTIPEYKKFKMGK